MTEKHRHELYRLHDLASMTFAGTVAHTGEIAEVEKVAEAAAGAEAAEEQLKRSLQRLQQEKESKKSVTSARANKINLLTLSRANIMNSVAVAPAKKNRPSKLLNVLPSDPSRKVTQSMPSSPSFPGASSSPMLGQSITSTANSQNQPEQMRALRSALIHFLAMGPASESVIARKTCSRRDEISPILLKVAKPTAYPSEWQLLDKSYKELDVWKHQYPSNKYRQCAVDNAVRAYDRIRLAQSDPLWQILLPRQERGKGKTLSRLAAHLGPKPNVISTPRLGPKTTDISNLDGPADVPASDDSHGRLGEAMKRSVSQEAIKKKRISEREAQSKRLLSKNPKKAQAAFEAKQKKQQEKETAKTEAKASRPTKGNTGKSSVNRQTKPVAKSSEFVHDSDEEEIELEIALGKSATKHAEPHQAQSQSRKRPAEEMTRAPKFPSSNKKAEPESQPPDSKKRRIEGTQEPHKRLTSSDKSTSNASAKSGTAKSRAKALNVPTNGTKSKSDISPRGSNTRPDVPSPLGAAKPLTASYGAERNPGQVTPDGKKAKKVTASSPIAQTRSINPPKGQADRSARTSATANHDEARTNDDRSTEVTPSDSKRTRTISAASSQGASNSDRSYRTPSSNGLKRKANDLDKDGHSQEPQSKIAKVETTSAQAKHHDRNNSGSTATPGDRESDPLSATTDEFPERLSPRQCRRLCEQMQTYYKIYEASRAKLEATPKHKRDPKEVAAHWEMHNRLLDMKRSIWNADIPRSEGEPRSWREYEARNYNTRRYTDVGSSGGSS